MADNEFMLKLLAMLDKSNSKKQINNDIKNLEKAVRNLRLTATLAKGTSKQQINQTIRQLEGQLHKIKLQTKIDARNLKVDINKALQNVSYNDIKLNVNSGKMKLQVQKAIADTKKIVQNSPISVNIDLKKDKLNNQLTTYLTKNSKIHESEALLKQADQLRNKIANINDRVSLRDATDNFQLFKSEVSATGYQAKSATDKIKGLLGNVTKIGSAFGVATIAVANFKKSLQTIKLNDSILMEINKVSNATRQEIESLGDSAFDTASKFGRLSFDFLTAVQEMNRSGFYGETGKALGELSLMAQAAGDITAETSQKYILATNAAYGYAGSIEKLTDVLDGQNYITNHHSVDMQTMAEATEKAGSVAANTGVKIDELSAMIGTISARTKEAGTITGTGIKSLLVNLQNISSDKIVGTLKKANASMTETVNGVEKLRSPISILKDLEKTYNSLDESDPLKSEITTNIGQKFHANQLSALLSGWTDYEKMLADYANGAGSALNEANLSANSLEGRLNSLQNSWDELVNSITNKSAIKNGVGFFDGILQSVTKLIDKFDVLPMALASITAFTTAKNKDYGITKVFDADSKKLSLEGNLFGIDFSQIKHFKEAEKAIHNWNSELANGVTDIASFNNETVKNNTQLRNYLSTCNDGSASLKGYKAHLQAAGEATNSLRLGTILLNTALSFVAGILISKAVSAITDYANRVDNAKESLDEFNNTVTTSKNELETQRKWIEEHGARYEELAKGVDNYGHVISLTADEISEYNSLTKDIESMFPSMISGYNVQNQAIVKMKGSVDELTKSYEENVKAAYAATLAKAGENFDDYKTSTLLAKNQKKYIDEIVNGNAKLKNVGVIKSPFTDDGENGLQKDTKGIVTGIDTDILDESLIEQIKEETKDVEKTFDELSASLQQKIRATLISANSTIKTETAKVKPILEAYVYGNGGKDSGYDALDEESKQVIRNVISRLDDSFYENFDSDSDMAAHFYSYYIEPLKDGLQDSDLAVKINTLFAINQESYESYQDYVNAIIDIINQLKGYVDNDGNPLYSDEQINALKRIFGVSSTNNSGELSGQALIDTVKDKYSKVDGAEEYIKSLNEKELRVLYDLEPDKTESLESMKQTMDELEKEAKEEPKVKSDTPSFTNFTDAWKSLDKITDDKSPLKDLKENLLSLASSGELTEKTFKKTEGAKTWMKQMEETGLSVEDVIKKINSLVLSADQLASMKTGISSISNILGEKKENLSEKKTRNTGIGADTLAGMPEEVKKCTKAYNKFCNVLGNGESSMADCRKAANQLATAYVNSNNFLANLTDGTKDYYISVLKEMGVENAEQIVTNELAKQKGLAAIKTADLTNMTYDEINALINEKGKTDEARNAMRLFALEKIYANGKGLDTTGDVEQLINLMEAFDIAVPAIQDYQNALKNYNPNEAMSDAVLEYYKNKAEKDYKNAIKKLKQKTKLTPPKIEVTPSPSPKEKDKGKSKKDSAKETTQVIDWIERHIHNLQNTIDLTAAKLQNLFSVKAKNSNLDKQIKTTTKLIKAYGIAAEKYQKKADKVAKASSKTVKDDDGKKKKVKIKGLCKEILNKIKSGKFTKNTSLSSLIKTYGEDIAEKIQEYINWYDKSQDAKKNKQEQITKKRELRQQKHQNIADKAQSQIDKLDAQKENVPVANAAKKNTLLKAQIKYIKQSYNEQIKIAKLEKDSVKAATLLAQRNAEILKIKKEILQNSLDKNEEKRTLTDAKYGNATSIEQKEKLIDDNIASYKSDKKAYEDYYKDIKSGSGIKTAKSNVSSVLGVIPLKVSGLTKGDKDKIKSLMKQGKKIPQNILKKVKHPALLQRLNEYNTKVDEVDAAKYTYELGKEQTDTAIRQEQIEKHQLRVDKAEGEYNLNQQYENNANTAKDKNKYESDSRKNLKEQYTHLIAIAKLNNDLTEAKRLQAEQEAKIAESYKKEFDNIKVWYELKTGRIDSEIGVTQAEVSALEAQGKTISGAFYDLMIKAEQKKKSELLAEKAELEKSLSNLTVGSPNWYDAKNSLDGVSTALYECAQNTAEWQKTINKLNMKPFENALSYLQTEESHIEFLINMLSHEILIDDDTGAFTSNGLTTMSLQLDEIANKEKQIANLRKEWSEYDFSNLSEEEIIAKNKDFQESIQSLIESTASLKDSIIDLCENALNTQLNALNDLISKYKDALNAEEDLYQYQKKIKEQTETIASLMKQQAALKGDESEETRARLQQIDVKLKEAQENLEETERQRTIDDINDMLDGLSEDFEDYITSALKDTDALIASVEQAIRENPQAIASALSVLGYGKSTDTNIKENPDGSKELTFSTSDGGFVTNKFDKDDNFIGSTVTDKNGSVVKTNDAKSADSATNNNNTSSETNTGISGGHSEGFNDKSGTIDTKIANLMYSGRTTTRLDGESNKINDYIKSKNGGMYITKQAWSQIKWLLKEKYELANVNDTPDNVIIETLKRAGFSQGGIVGSSDVDKVLAANGDDVLITAKVGEQILKPVDSENFIKLNNMLPNTVDVMENFVNAKPEMPHPELVRATEMNLGGVTIKLDGSNVVDFPTFKKDFENELRTDSSFKSMLGNAVTSMISGGHTNRMGRF